MADPFVRLKINKRYEAQPCPWCTNALQLGEDGAVCEACGTAHHAACWDAKNGCGNPKGCLNAPFKQELAPTEPVSDLPPDWIRCPHCKNPIWASNVICPECSRVTSPDGIYHGPKTTSSEAKKALAQAIISFFICAPILGPIAIKNANLAISSIDNDPRLEGRGMASAAKVLGVIAIILWAIGFLMRFANA
jgi:hypothetical protein